MCVRRLMNGAMVGAFAAWYEYTSERVQQRDAVAKSLGKILNGALNAAFSTWRDTVEETVTMRTKLTKMMQKLEEASVICPMFQRSALILTTIKIRFPFQNRNEPFTLRKFAILSTSF